MAKSNIIPHIDAAVEFMEKHNNDLHKLDVIRRIATDEGITLVRAEAVYFEIAEKLAHGSSSAVLYAWSLAELIGRP